VLVGVFHATRETRAFSTLACLACCVKNSSERLSNAFCIGSAEVSHRKLHHPLLRLQRGKETSTFASYNPHAEDLYHGGLSNGMISISRNLSWTSGFSCWLFEYQVASPPLLKSFPPLTSTTFPASLARFELVTLEQCK